MLHAHDGHALTLAGLAAGPHRDTAGGHPPSDVPPPQPILLAAAPHESSPSQGRSVKRWKPMASPRNGWFSSLPRLSSRPRLSPRMVTSASESRSLPNTGQLAVSLGALTPEKDQFTLVEAAALLVRDLPDLHWAIVGEMGRFEASLERRIAQRGLQGRFHLLGHLPDPHDALGRSRRLRAQLHRGRTRQFDPRGHGARGTGRGNPGRWNP